MQNFNILTLVGAGVAGAAILAAVVVMSGAQNEAEAARSTTAPPSIQSQAQTDLAAAPTMISSAEANAWAAARAADNADAYRVYLAAYPTGEFATEAMDRLAAPEPAPRQVTAAPAAPRVQRIVASEPAAPRRNVAAECRAYVDQTLTAPSRTYRTAGGAVAGCAVGAMAGGDDGRNCVVGAIAGGAAGAISAESRERRRMNEVQYCIANGGPPR